MTRCLRGCAMMQITQFSCFSCDPRPISSAFNQDRMLENISCQLSHSTCPISRPILAHQLPRLTMYQRCPWNRLLPMFQRLPQWCRMRTWKPNTSMQRSFFYHWCLTSWIDWGIRCKVWHNKTLPWIRVSWLCNHCYCWNLTNMTHVHSLSGCWLWEVQSQLSKHEEYCPMKHIVPEYNLVGWCLVNQASIYRLLTGGGQLKHPSCDPTDFGIAPTQVVLDFLTSGSPCIIPAPSPSTQDRPLSTTEVVRPMSTSVTLTRNLSLAAWTSCSHPSVKCGTTLAATALASVTMYLHQYRPNPAEFLAPVRYCPGEDRSHMAKMANHHFPAIDSMVSATRKNSMQTPLYLWTSLGTLVNCPVILPI